MTNEDGIVPIGLQGAIGLVNELKLIEYLTRLQVERITEVSMVGFDNAQTGRARGGSHDD
jgi:hypothetical protein